MMKYLAVALLLSALLSPTNAGCQPERLKLDEQRNYCWDDADRSWHAVGSFWINPKCEHCTCHGCCIAYSTPQSYPADCVSVFDWEACQYRVHKRNDPTEECPIYSETVY